MAQIRDLIVAGKAKIVGSGTISGLLNAEGGLQLSTSALSTPTFVLTLSNSESQVTRTNVLDLSVGTASQLSTTSVGNTTTPVYWANGVPTKLSGTAGTTSKPVYLNGGTLTACSATVGGTATPVYMNAGTITKLSDTIGGASGAPVYLNAGAITAMTKVGVAYGGTGKTSWTSNAIIYASGSTTLAQLSTGTSGQVLTSSGNSAAPQWVNASTLSVGTASKLGTTTIGGSTNPIYLNAGTPTACGTCTSGSWFSGVPAVGSDGVMEIGRYIDFHCTSASTNDYDKRIDAGATATKTTLTLPGVSGEFVTHTAGASQGSATQFTYVNTDGQVVATTTTVGGAAKPVYMSSGIITACSSTVGSKTKPVFMSSGTITASDATVGAKTKPIFMSSGTITASDATVGSASRPMYLSSGTMTAVTAVGIAYGGTGATAQTAYRLVTTDSNGNLVSNNNHYASGTAVCINSTSLPSSDAAFYVKGNAQVDGSISLDNKVKFQYNNTDKCVDIIFS